MVGVRTRLRKAALGGGGIPEEQGRGSGRSEAQVGSRRPLSKRRKY